MTKNKTNKRLDLKKILPILLILTVVLLLNNRKTEAEGFNIEVSPAKVSMNLEKGSTNIQKFRIGNYSGGDRTLYLYVQDFTVINELGTPTFIENESEADSRYSLRKWVQVPFDQIEVANDEVVEVEVTVNVPEDAEPGGHYGAFFVQTAKPEATGSAIGSIGRFASLMLVNVAGDAKEELVLTQAYTDKDIYWNDNPTFQFVTYVKNNGNVHGVPIGAFNISGGYGFTNKSVIYNQMQGAVLPGAPERKISERFTMEKSGIIPPIGKFQLNLVARYGSQNFPLETTVYFWLLPLRFIIISLLLALLVLFITWRALVSFKK